MRVVMNSDVLFWERPPRGIPHRLRDFCQQSAAAGARVELVDPLLEDYVEAERRASLHLSPQASKKADEMRDLVIWALSLRIARESGRAMLVSRDEVHSGNLGKDEASTNGLLRASSLEDALELLGRETPAGSLARTLLAAVWQPLREAGLPITTGVVIRRLERLSFLADAAGHTGGTFALVTDAAASGSLSAWTSIRQVGPHRIAVDLEDITLDGAQWQSGSISLEVDGELPVRWTPTRDRLVALRSVIQREQ